MSYFHIKKPLLTILLFVVFISCKQSETGDIILSKINIINIENGTLNKEQDVIINGNKIAKIIPHNQAKLASNTIVDCTNKYLIPGLWDMHAHIRSYASEDVLPMFVLHGITGIRDLGITDYELIKHWKNQIEKKEIVGPRIISSGSIIEGAGPTFANSVVINKLENVEPVLDSLIAKNIQVVKLFHNFSPEIYKDIIRYSKEKGIVTSGHIPAGMNQVDAAKAGLTSIEHFWGISESVSNYNEYNVSDEDLKKLADILIKNGTYQTPTIVNMESYAERGQDIDPNLNLKLTPKYFLSWWANINERSKQNITDENRLEAKKRLDYNAKLNAKPHELGVKILAGTDVPNPYVVAGVSLHNELEHFVKGGMSTTDALKTATLYPAQYFNRSNELGLIAENYIADALILDANPLDNISNTQQIHAVIQNGQLFTQEKLEQIKTNQLNRLAEFNENDFDQMIYMGVRRIGIEGVKKNYTNNDETKNKYNIKKHHLIRLSKTLKDALKTKEAIKALEWNLELFPEDETTRALVSEYNNL